MHRGRDLGSLDRPGGAVSARTACERAGLGERSDGLLEKRRPSSALDELIAKLTELAVIAEQRRAGVDRRSACRAGPREAARSSSLRTTGADTPAGESGAAGPGNRRDCRPGDPAPPACRGRSMQILDDHDKGRAWLSRTSSIFTASNVRCRCCGGLSVDHCGSSAGRSSSAARRQRGRAQGRALRRRAEVSGPLPLGVALSDLEPCAQQVRNRRDTWRSCHAGSCRSLVPSGPPRAAS